MTTFAESFWPNAAATLVGVVLGVPVALWLRRLAEAHRSARQREHLALALDELRAALKFNHEILETAHTSIESGFIVTGFDPDLAVWEVHRAEILDGLPRSAGLRGRLARFFASLALFAKHLERYVSLCIQSRPGQTMLVDPEEALGRAPLMAFAQRLIADVAPLRVELARQRAALRAAAPATTASQIVAGVAAAAVMLAALVALIFR